MSICASSSDFPPPSRSAAAHAIICTVEATELRVALESHTDALRKFGVDVDGPEVLEPATLAEIDEVEAQLGLQIPVALRGVFAGVTAGVRWRWQTIGGVDFNAPFDGIFSGGLEWSLSELVEQHRGYQEWVDECFSDPDDAYDAIWLNKLGFAYVPNGDCIAVDLTPQRAGDVVYLSHDDGEGHGFVLAHSLDDLLDRWVPLACPGPEDWQWLPFVPYDFGPIDPASENGLAWRQLLGLSAAPPRTPASVADDALFDELVARSRAAVEGWEAHRLAARALSVCNADRAESVIGLLSEDGPLQGEAARKLGQWQWRPAVEALKHVAVAGSNYGRRSAIIALRSMPYAEARGAIDDLRGRLSQDWQAYLR